LPDDESIGGPNAASGGPPYPAVGRRLGYGYRNGGYRSGRRGAAVPTALLDGRRRSLSEYAMPAAVILAGVLIVVAFGFIINRAMRSDDNEALPQPQPPALGGAATLPPADQEIIPLPSPSATDSATPGAPATSRPPARKTAPPPDNGSIKIVRAAVPSLVDLSAEGSRDWVHWGEQSTFSLERDKNGKFAILEGSPVAPRFRHGLSPQKFSWQDGSPVDHSDGTPTGIRTCGKNNGFTISVPATDSSRTLRLYLGVLGGRGRLDAKLSTGGGTTSTKLEQRANSLLTSVFVVTYRAPRDGKLNLNWVTEAAFNSDCGGVALEAATLR
jgi:hypothetical protein